MARYRLLLTILLTVLCLTARTAPQIPDTVLTLDKVYYYALANKDYSLRILHDMRNHRKESAWKIDMAEGDVYCINRLLIHALAAYDKAYNNTLIYNNKQLRMKLLVRMLFCYEFCNREKEFARTLYQLDQLAHQTNDIFYQSIFNFIRGKREHYHGNKEQGIQLCLESKEAIAHTDHPWRYFFLQYFYASLVRMYTLEKKFDKAMEISKEQERVAALPLPFPILNSERRAIYRVYAFRTFLYIMKGDTTAAEACYRTCRFQDVFDPISDSRIVYFLDKTKRYHEMLYYVDRTKALLSLDGDTVSTVMGKLIEQEGDALYGLGKYKESAESYNRQSGIVDSLNRRASIQMHSSAKEAIDRQRQLSRRTVMLSFAISAFLVVMVSLLFIYIYNRELKHKNKEITETLQKVSFYSDKMVDNHFVTYDKKAAKTSGKTLDKMRARFDEIDYRINKEELFRNPDFGRDDLMRLLRVDKNTLSFIIHHYTGTNVTGYINSKRMEYAVSLMKDHPDYTLNAIAEACGVKTPATFIRNFKHFYGLTPSEFRIGLLKTLSSHG